MLWPYLETTMTIQEDDRHNADELFFRFLLYALLIEGVNVDYYLSIRQGKGQMESRPYAFCDCGTELSFNPSTCGAYIARRLSRVLFPLETHHLSNTSYSQETISGVRMLRAQGRIGPADLVGQQHCFRAALYTLSPLPHDEYLTRSRATWPY